MTADWHPLLTVLMVMWVSGLCAAVMNNVSYTTAVVTIVGAFLAVTPVFRHNVELQHLMWWGLALAVCLGANGTVVGSASNLVAVGVAEKGGLNVGFKTYIFYGAPVAIGCLIASSLYVIARYYMLCR
jgi:Na+/H+ antiporter NhaD/arsenite permease-like protein